VLDQLKTLLRRAYEIDQRFIHLNRDSLYPGQLREENELRTYNIRQLYQRLAKYRT
jgi:hypothetical protein